MDPAVWVAPNWAARSRLSLQEVDGDDFLGPGQAGPLYRRSSLYRRGRRRPLFRPSEHLPR